MIFNLINEGHLQKQDAPHYFYSHVSMPKRLTISLIIKRLQILDPLSIDLHLMKKTYQDLSQKAGGSMPNARR